MRMILHVLFGLFVVGGVALSLVFTLVLVKAGSVTNYGGLVRLTQSAIDHINETLGE